MDFKPAIIVAPERVLHVCRLGSRLGYRSLGTLTIYVGLEDNVSVDIKGEGVVTARVVTVTPYARHRITAGPKFVKTILIEPETASDICLDDLKQSLNQLDGAHPRYVRLQQELSNFDETEQVHQIVASNAAFDQALFGYALARRDLDERIHFTTEFVTNSLAETVQIADAAEHLDISSSQLRRLFVRDTGVQFRRYRMWKRARSYLACIFETGSLTETALNLGYPDSTHFSKSIRQTYGLPPREMRGSMMGSKFICHSTMQMQ